MITTQDQWLYIYYFTLSASSRHVFLRDVNMYDWRSSRIKTETVQTGVWTSHLHYSFLSSSFKWTKNPHISPPAADFQLLSTEHHPDDKIISCFCHVTRSEHSNELKWFDTGYLFITVNYSYIWNCLFMFTAMQKREIMCMQHVEAKSCI